MLEKELDMVNIYASMQRAIDDEIEIPVQFNGKLKAVVKIDRDADENTVKEIVKNDETVKKALEGKNIVKEIYVKAKVYNIVVK